MWRYVCLIARYAYWTWTPLYGPVKLALLLPLSSKTPGQLLSLFAVAWSIKCGAALILCRLRVQIALRNEILEICESSYTGHHQFCVLLLCGESLAGASLPYDRRDSHQPGCKVMSLSNKEAHEHAKDGSVPWAAGERRMEESQAGVGAKVREEVQQACQVEDCAAGSVHH